MGSPPVMRRPVVVRTGHHQTRGRGVRRPNGGVRAELTRTAPRSPFLSRGGVSAAIRTLATRTTRNNCSACAVGVLYRERFSQTPAVSYIRYYREHIEKPFLRKHLQTPGGPAQPELPTAVVYEVGANRWRRFNEWPPAAAVRRPASLWTC